MLEAGRLLGLNAIQIFYKLGIPIIRPAIIGGAMLVAMETLSDFGAVEHFAIQTFTTGIFRAWYGMYDMNSAIRLAFFLITFVFIVLAFEKVLRKGAKYDGRGGNNSLERIELRGQKQLPVIRFCLTLSDYN